MPGVINHRYQVIRPLGQGGMGMVYLVQDKTRGDAELALKMVRPDALGERGLAQFQYEFAALAQLRHPNLVTVYDFGNVTSETGLSGAGSLLGQVFFTMEVVPGEDLLGVAAAMLRAEQAQASFDGLYPIVVQVCRALQYLHSRGFIHYDVKPRNIRVMPEGRVKLMDFGLIGEARSAGLARLRGTPDYVAPEIVRGEDVDQRADFYSLGVSLYEIVNGRLPFADSSTEIMLRKRLENSASLEIAFAENVPSVLQDFIRRLMAREPGQRFQSADQVIQAINSISGSNFPVETPETVRGYIQSAGLVGREYEMARLQGLLMRALQGQGRLVLLAGPLGMGKMRLARELKSRAQMQRVLVIEATCKLQTTPPFKPWVEIFSQLAAYYRSAKPELLRLHAPALVQLMPELGAEFEALPPQKEVHHRELLLGAALQFVLACDLPLLIFIYGLHSIDADSLVLLEQLGQEATNVPLLVCGVYRDDEVSETHPLNALIRRARAIGRQGEAHAGAVELPFDLLRLGPLSETETLDYVRSMLGVSGEAAFLQTLVSRLLSQTGGIPDFIETLMQNLVDEDQLRFDGEQWTVDVNQLSLPGSILEANRRRLERLGPDTLDLLQWAASMGQTIYLDVLLRVCGQPLDLALGMLNKAAWQHVLEIDQQGGQNTYRFSSDPIREAVYSTLHAGVRPERHRRISQELRQLYADEEVAEILTWHAGQAGDLAELVHYATLAAQKATRMSAYEAAAHYATQALGALPEGDAPVDPASQFALLQLRQQCFDELGRREAQQHDLEKMAFLAEQLDDDCCRLQVLNGRAGLMNAQGDYHAALALLQPAVDLARRIGERALEAQGLMDIGDAGYALGQSDLALSSFESALQIYRELDDLANQARCLRAMGRLLFRMGRLPEAVECIQSSLQIVRQFGDQRGEADSLNSLAAMEGDYALARAYYEQILAIRQSIGDQAGLSVVYNNLAMIYWGLGLYTRARDYMEQSVEIARKLDIRPNLPYYLESLSRIYLGLKEYEQALVVLDEGLLLSVAQGVLWMEGVYRIVQGQVYLQLERLQEALETTQQSVSILESLNSPELATALVWNGVVHERLGDWEMAYEHTARAVAILRQTHTSGDYPPQDIWWQHYKILCSHPGQPAEAALEEERWVCLQQAWLSMMAGIVSLSDDGLRRNYLNKVETNHQILIEYTRQAARRGISIDAALQEEPQAAPPTSQVQDKIKRVLDISVQMNETRDAEALFNYVMDQVIELTGAERSFLVLVSESGQMDFKIARGMAEDEIERARAQISYTILGEVARSRKPVLLQDALTDERFGRQGSVLELNLRSVLCVPLLNRAELVGMIYADNRSVSGRFSQADLDLLAIFANQAASAIENTRLYQQLHEWAHTLEQRVVDRTQQLEEVNEILSRRALQLEASSQVGRQVTTFLSLPEMLRGVVRLIHEQFGYYSVSIWLATPSMEYAELRAANWMELGDADPLRIELGANSIIAGVCRTGKRRLVNDVRQAEDYLFMPELAGTLAEVALPLRAGDRIFGALDIQVDQPALFAPDDMMTLQTLADQIAIAIRNAQLYQSEQSRRHLAEALEQAGRELSSSLEMGEVVGRILDQLGVVVPFDRGALMLQEGDELVMVARSGFPETRPMADLRVAIEPGDVYDRLAQRASTLVLDDVTSTDGWRQLEGLEIHKSWMGVPLISNGRVIGMVSMTRRKASAFAPEDATLASTFAVQAAIALENANLYQQITRFNTQLEQMVDQRTHELQQAYEKLERMDRTKSDFIQVTSHELRTPLTVLRGYSQMILQDAAINNNPVISQLATGILSGANRMHEIVNSMLDIAKIDSAALELSPEPLSLSALVMSVAVNYDQAFREREQKLVLKDLNSLLTIEADPDALRKVFNQLIINAIKYTPDRGVITLSAHEIEAGSIFPDGGVEVLIQDTGIGIDPAHHDLIFEKFYQTGEVSTHSSGKIKFKGGGPGLGLPIARGIVEAHGGQIWVESPGHDEEACPGSIFHVMLPRHIPRPAG
jgi:signal transduction histidine kinase